MQDQLERAYRAQGARSFALITGSGSRRRRTKEKVSRAFQPSVEDETRLAEMFTGADLWGALRDVGLEPNNLPRSRREEFLEGLALEWAGRFADDNPELGIDPNRVRMRILLSRIDIPAVFSGTNAALAGMKEYAESGDVRRLEYGAKAIRTALGAAGRWQATLDLCSAALGEGDLQVSKLRERLESDLADLKAVVDRARPLLEEHGLADGIFPEDTS